MVTQPEDCPVFLLLPDAGSHGQGFVAAPWCERWSAVEHLPATLHTAAEVDGWLLDRFGPFLRLSPQMPPPQPVGAQVGLAVSELDQLHMACTSAAPWAFVLFIPSQLACLDMLRKGRNTLVAARALHPGQTITADDLALKVGGLGIDALHKDRVLGCGLCYPVQAGDDITFGFLQWTEQTP
jgi:hypothetical protein